MSSLTFMLIAGEPSGDLLAAELVRALKRSATLRASPFPPAFFGAGGSNMARAGVELAVDLTRHSVIGLTEALKKYRQFKRIFDRLLSLAIERKPEVLICVDFSGFNRRFAHAIRRYVRARDGSFNNWNPRIVQYVSPQVWASRPGRARQMAEDYDMLLSILPFEKAWYAARAPRLRVAFVGHPIVDRYPGASDGKCATEAGSEKPGSLRRGDECPDNPVVLLLPGSRRGELKRHLPVMVDAVKRITATLPVRPLMVLPDDNLMGMAADCRGDLRDLHIQVGGLPEAFRRADVAIASTGTVTLECAWFGVPTVTLYKTSWSTYLIGRQIVTVKYLAMPNLLAGEEVFPEFVQHRATGSNIAAAVLALLTDRARREAMRARLKAIAEMLGSPGASDRAAAAVLEMLVQSPAVRETAATL